MGTMNGRLAPSDFRTDTQSRPTRYWPVLLYFLASFFIFASVMIEACVIVPEIREASEKNRLVFEDQVKHDRDIDDFRKRSLINHADLTVKIHQLGLEIDRLNRQAQGEK